jgi:hypothetical protein
MKRRHVKDGKKGREEKKGRKEGEKTYLSIKFSITYNLQ